MLWFFAWLVSMFDDLHGVFGRLSDDIAAVPYVGPSLASPFGWISDYFVSLRTAAQALGDWADTVYTSSYAIFSGIYYNLTAAFPVLTASAGWFFGQVRDQIASYWSILSMDAHSVFVWLRSSILATWPVLSATPSWFFAQVRDQIASYWGILTMSASSLASWLWPSLQALGAGVSLSMDSIWSQIVSGRLQSWIAAWFEGVRDDILDIVTGSWGYITTSMFAWFDANWTSVESSFAWLATKILDLMTKQAASFAGSLWGLLEAILAKIDTDR
ncbi:MAG: hypothetical protein WC455_25215 [Dehalococcoidia bacterium]|jgi:hypothetical protein